MQSKAIQQIQDVEKNSELLDDIIKQKQQDPVAHINPHNIVLGKIAHVGEGSVSVAFTGGSTLTNVVSLCPLNAKDVGKVCAIQFIEADIAKPLIMGLLHTHIDSSLYSQESKAPSDITLVRQGKQVIISAEDELVLQCGESSIVMTAEGVVYIRALYIDSHALATQRLRGGSVQVN